MAHKLGAARAPSAASRAGRPGSHSAGTKLRARDALSAALQRPHDVVQLPAESVCHVVKVVLPARHRRDLTGLRPCSRDSSSPVRCWGGQHPARSPVCGPLAVRWCPILVAPLPGGQRLLQAGGRLAAPFLQGGQRRVRPLPAVEVAPQRVAGTVKVLVDLQAQVRHLASELLDLREARRLLDHGMRPRTRRGHCPQRGGQGCRCRQVLGGHLPQAHAARGRPEGGGRETSRRRGARLWTGAAASTNAPVPIVFRFKAGHVCVGAPP
mmetsp:Transcript_81533/g.230818  ORF Transcript_81533/g.230818 Transcript_81533/m.230818 type:complete len:267 (-) Transcript_81533:2568-3368(-)